MAHKTNAAATWKRAQVSVDNHLGAKRHYYSVPHQLFGEGVDVRIAASTIEIFVRGRRVAGRGAVSTARGSHCRMLPPAAAFGKRGQDTQINTSQLLKKDQVGVRLSVGDQGWKEVSRRKTIHERRSPAPILCATALQRE